MLTRAHVPLPAYLVYLPTCLPAYLAANVPLPAYCMHCYQPPTHCAYWYVPMSRRPAYCMHRYQPPTGASLPRAVVPEAQGS